MKKTIQFSLLFAFVSIIAFINPAKAQDDNKDFTAFAKKFEDAYNKKDAKALKGMFTKDAVRTDADGTVYNGSDSILGALEESMKNKVTIVIKQEKAVTENGSTVASGTYVVNGSSQSGEQIDYKGGYVNTMVKEGGQWKIAKQLLTAL